MKKQLHFWFDFASTYTYPAVMRASRLAAEQGVEVVWHAFLLGAVFQQYGWNDSPFNLFPAKGKYMWKDMARLCQQEGIALNRPSVFPRNGLLPARIVASFAAEAWISDFIQQVFTANFVQDHDINQLVVIEAILNDLQLDAGQIIQQATSDAGKQKLKDETALALQQEVFGAPFFMVGDEPFWGNDRLEQAIAYAAVSH
jgi:2-hydroxychromene-2-carboxylate isomerase